MDREEKKERKKMKNWKEWKREREGGREKQAYAKDMKKSQWEYSNKCDLNMAKEIFLLPLH